MVIWGIRVVIRVREVRIAIITVSSMITMVIMVTMVTTCIHRYYFYIFLLFLFFVTYILEATTNVILFGFKSFLFLSCLISLFYHSSTSSYFPDAYKFTSVFFLFVHILSYISLNRIFFYSSSISYSSSSFISSSYDSSILIELIKCVSSSPSSSSYSVSILPYFVFTFLITSPSGNSFAI